jgi:hypothetical protein
LAALKQLYSVVSRIAIITLLVATGLFATAAFAGTRPNVPIKGFPQIGANGISRTMSDIMAEEASHAGEPQEPPTLMNELEGPDRSHLPQNPASPAVASIPEMPVDQLVYHPEKQIGFVPFAPQTIGVNFTATNLAGTGSFPPDNDGAVGPTQYIVAVNGRIISFNKTTGAADGVMNTTTNTFFTSVRNASGTSDPMCRYDRLSGRWFLSIINVSTPNRWLLAVSDAASNGTITGGTVWTYYFFIPATSTPTISNGNTCLADYPSLGIDANALYMGVDEFCGAGQPFQQTDVFVIRKSSVLSGGPIVVTTFRGLMTAAGGFVGPFAPRGIDNFDAGTNEGYFIGTDGASFGTLWLNRVADPGGIPTLSSNIAITCPTTAGARPVPHPSNTGGYWGRLDPLDDRPFHAVIRNQQLWTSHNIGVNNVGVSTQVYANDTRVGARWYQINVPVNAGLPTIVQAGTVFAASATNDSLQKNYFIPSINVSGQGHAAMGFSTAGETDNANAGSVGRLATDPLGTMQTPVALTTSTSAYNPPSDPGGISAGRPRRWGDYSITSLDPLDDMSMWTVQEFCDANNSYGVRVARLVAPPPATPSAMADVQTGLSSVSVTLTGTSVAGSGCYDPGPDLASPARPFNHLSATVTSGTATGVPPTVVSATYVNPTTVSVVLNTSAATANLPGEKYTLTVTNPDGQTSAGAVVHVVNTAVTATAGAGGSISPSGVVSVPFGGNPTFNITANACFSISDVLVDGASVGAVPSYTFTNVTVNHTIAASFVAGLSNAVTSLGAAQVKLGNGASGTTGIMLTYTVPLGSTSVEVWRKGFGSYPFYAVPPGTGAVPLLPGSYPPAGWTLASGVTASGQMDTPGSRDDWYYVAYGKDGCGDNSPVSNMTSGTLDYHLGDISNGITSGQGDNTVNIVDASLLGAHYGASGGALSGFEYLDVGPTTDNSTNGRPTVDGAADFEDLVMLALNYSPHVSIAARARPAGARPLGSVAGDVVSLHAPRVVNPGDACDVTVDLAGTGDLHALSLALGWDAAVVQPVGMTPGEFVASQGGVVFSPGPGRADAALLGVGAQGLVGQGAVANMRFRVLKAGDPRISIARVVGRDALNRAVTVTIQGSPSTTLPATATDLYPVIPNPTRGTSLLQYSLVKAGPVNLAIYSVDGRLVKTLVHGVQEAGRYQFTWDGTDAQGTLIKSGMFYVRFEASGMRKSRVLAVIQ